MLPIELHDPVEAIKFRLEQTGLNVSAHAEILGSKSHASEILNRKRSVSLSMIRMLHRKLNISAGLLIAEYPFQHNICTRRTDLYGQRIVKD
jgi:HTH-type transcriptional regulator / antitoxin HigA